MSDQLYMLRVTLFSLILSGWVMIPPLQAQTVTNTTPLEETTGPRDLTAIIDEGKATDSTSQTDAAAAPAGGEQKPETSIAETAGDTSTGTPAIVAASPGLRRQDPSAIRLAALGVERPDLDGLDRLMWDGSQAERILQLNRMLPEEIPARVLHDRLVHVMMARSVPPEGSVDMAEALVLSRLDWLRHNIDGDEMAELVRQLPLTGEWMDWQTWLVYHDLLTREDAEACEIAFGQAASTLEPLWHQINAFCHVIQGEYAKASFALDILEDRGVDDPVFFTLMRKLTGAADEVGEVAGNSELLNLVLMDSARMSIDEELIGAVDIRYRSSLNKLRYLSDSAALLQGARIFRDPQASITDVIATWALLPPSKVPASEALARLRLSGTEDEIDLARLYTWQATVLEEDAKAAADLAYAALEIDRSHVGIRSLELWLPFIAASVDDAEMALKAGPLVGLDATLGNQPTAEAAAWFSLLALADDAVDPSDLILAGALDAVPLLEAVGMEVPPLVWEDHLDHAPSLAGAAMPLSLARLKALEAAAATGRKAETLIMAVLALDTTPLHQLSRDDAARLAGALHQAGMEKTARDLARDILKSWALHRHFAESGKGKAANAS